MLASDTATLFVMAVGVTFVIMLGGIDLSIQSVASLTSVVVALCLPRFGYLGFALATLVGALAGILSGVAHVKLKIPSFIATLAIGGIAAGTALIISDAQAITMAAGERAYLGWITGDSLGLPHEVIIGAVVLAVGLFVQRYTAFGRYSQAIGAGEPAAYASGVKVDRHKIIAFVLSGTLRGLRRRDPRRAARERLADARQRAAAAGDRRGHRRRHGDHGRRRQRLAHADRRARSSRSCGSA